jgi:hypothetical protein
MGGRYDAINNQLSGDNWPFHTMMIIYFFFTVILMLNVLIGKLSSFWEGREWIDRIARWMMVNRLKLCQLSSHACYII